MKYGAILMALCWLISCSSEDPTPGLVGGTVPPQGGIDEGKPVAIGAAQSGHPGSVDVGNGGDFLICKKSAHNLYEGKYSLDYILTDVPSVGPEAEIKSWKQSKTRLLKQLTRLNGDLALRFKDFIDLAENQSDFAQPRIWESAVNGLIDIDDEKMIQRVPENCLDKERPKMIQAVIRTHNVLQTSYAFSNEHFMQVKRDRPKQFSYLMVHEWSWDLSNDVRKIRNFNRLLHSKKLESMSPNEFRANLRNLGIGLNMRIIDGGVYQKANCKISPFSSRGGFSMGIHYFANCEGEFNNLNPQEFHCHSSADYREICTAGKPGPIISFEVLSQYKIRVTTQRDTRDFEYVGM